MTTATYHDIAPSYDNASSREEALLQEEPFLKAKTVSQNVSALQCEDSSQNDIKVNQLL